MRLSEPSLVAAGYVSAGDTTPLALGSTAALEHRQRLLTHQQQVAKRIEAAFAGCEIEAAYQIAFNGLTVRVPAADNATLMALRQLAGVSAVYEDVAYRPTLYSSLGDIGASALWNTLGGAGRAGEGVKIAVLDSGILTRHPMFSASAMSYPTGYPKGDTRDTSAKVIAARIYVRPDDPPVAGEERPAPGAKGSSHGTHVAGIAAGNTVSATYAGVAADIAGVAPRAWLLNYRVFYPALSGLETAYEAEILRAVEDALLDGADVLCCSWTALSARAPEASALGEALVAASQAGCVVVASAGDDGPGYGTVSRVPGAVGSAITVGAVSKSREIVINLADVATPSPVPDDLRNRLFAPALFGGALQGTLGPFPVADVRLADPQGSALACDALPPGSLAGKIAVAARGECDFAAKAYHAQQAGAIALVISNDSDELFPMSCAGAYCGAGVVRIPVVLVTRTVGQRLAGWAAAHPDATLTLDGNGRLLSVAGGVVEAYSGRGPANQRYLKPDVVAPGKAVLSAAFTDTGSASYAVLSGSSMATAHVAGAAALLVQAHPSWSPAEIKALLMASARVDGLTLDDGATWAGVLDRGAGRVDLSAAASPAVLISPPSVSLSETRPGDAFDVTLSLRDVRSSGGARTYTMLQSVSGSLTIVPSPTSVTLSPGQRTTLALRIQINPGASAGDLTGDLYLASGSVRLHIPVWAHVYPAADTAQVLLIDNDFSYYGGYRDYASYVTGALNALGVTYRVWDTDVRYDQLQTLPAVSYLQGFDAVIWLTGDNVHPDGYFVVPTPLTGRDQAILRAYLDGGGRLLAIGQNLAEASDINPAVDAEWGRSDLYHGYLGAHWLQGSVFDPLNVGYYPPAGRASVVGWPGSAFAGLSLDLGSFGDGARNQNSVDEIAPGGLRDGSDADLVQPLLMTTEGYPYSDGCVAVGKWSDPSLEQPAAQIPYRSLYLAFGLEGVNNNPGSTPRAELLDRCLDWLLGTVSVRLDPLVLSTTALHTVHCQAVSSIGYAVTQYRWWIEDQRGVREVITSAPSVSLQYDAPGSYSLAVEAMDALGHRAISETTVLASPLGESTLTVTPELAPRLGQLAYRVSVRNATGSRINASFSMPLPAGTEYVAHNGGTFNGTVYQWSGSLDGEASLALQLRVRVKASAAPGTRITATGVFVAGGTSVERQAVAMVVAPLYIPHVER
ncbi:MAG: S8 family serine peptidase [Chloroflexi bacterium]|nr:S8 family serine peptidase [Chloroflexota bacterium]